MKLKLYAYFVLSYHTVFLLTDIESNINNFGLLLFFYSLVISFFVPIWIFGVFYGKISYLGLRVLETCLAQTNYSVLEYNPTGKNNIQYELRNGLQTLRPLAKKL